jgi:hypothetical protein
MTDYQVHNATLKILPSLESVADSLKKLSNPLVEIITEGEFQRRETQGLRDFFAGCALIGLVDKIGVAQYFEEDAAQSAYLAADAMLKARGTLKE